MKYYLRADDRAAMLAALDAAGLLLAGVGGGDPQPRLVSASHALDIIGMIQEPTGQMIEIEGEQIEEMADIPGYFANLDWTGANPLPAALASIVIEPPGAPQRAFGEALPSAPENPPVPPVIALWQAHAVLKGAGLLDAAEALIAASGNETMKTFWIMGNEIHRNAPTLNALAAGIGLDQDDLDNLFRAGAALTL